MIRSWCRDYSASFDFKTDYQAWVVSEFSGILCVDEVYQGALALLLGVRPDEVHRWHMSLYIDAVDWVSAPNVLGMSQYADGGIVGTKPYCASGNYIGRMSDYCRGCRYDPRKSEGEDACPFTTLYWDFLLRHRQRFTGNRRMALQMKNLARKSPSECRAIRRRAGRLKRDFTAETYLC